MKILSIALHNINSISGTYTIHLDTPPLNNAGLFLISGNTGAGKSTILDAITLALFNQIPRNNKEKNPVHVLTQGKDKCYAKLRFRIDGKVYLAEWSCEKRLKKSRKEGTISEEYDIERSISEEIGKEQYLTLASGKKTQVAEKISEILKGLNFEQFCRSILLAQGEFAKLLKEDTKTRSEILQRITNMEIYDDMSQAAHKKVTLAKQEVEAINKQLQQKGVELLSAEEESALKNEILALEAKLVEQIHIQENQVSELAKLERAKHLQGALAQSEAQLQKALAESEDLQSISEALEKHDKVAPYIIELDRRQRLAEEIAAQTQEKSTFENNVANYNAEVTLANEKLLASELAYKEAKELLENQESIWVQASKYDQEISFAAQQLQILESDALSNQNDLAKANEELEKLQERLKNGKAFLQSQEALLATLEHQAPSDLLEIRSNKADYEKLQVQLQDFESKLQKAKASLEENDNKQKIYLSKSIEYANRKKALQEEYAAFLKTYDLVFDDYQLMNLQKLEQSLQEKTQLLQNINEVIQLEEANGRLLNQAEAIQEDINQNKLLLAQLEAQYQTKAKEEAQSLAAITKAQSDLENLKKQHHKQAFLIEALLYRQNHLHIGDHCPVCTQICLEIPKDLEDELNQNLREILNDIQDREDKLNIEQKALQALAEALKQIDQEKHYKLLHQENLINNKAQLFDQLKINHDNASKLIANNHIDINITNGIDVVALLETATSVQSEKETLVHAIAQAAQWRQDYKFTCNSLSNEENNIQQLKIFNNTIIEELNKYNTEYKTMQRQSKEKIKVLEKGMLLFGLSIENLNQSIEILEERIKQRQKTSEVINKAQLEIEKIAFLLDTQNNTKANLESQTIALSNNISQLQEDIQHKKADRNAILPLHLLPEQMRQAARKDLNEKEAIYKKEADAFYQLRQSFERWKGQIESLSASIANKSQAFAQITQQLESIAQDFGLDNINAMQDWILPNAQALRDNIKQQQITIETLKKDLAQMQAEMQTLPRFEAESYKALIDKIEATKIENNKAHQRIGNIKSQIERFEKDKESHKQLMDLKAEKEAVYLRWYELDRLIGSSDGKKFRVFAQSITLKNLVAYANVHLSKFLDGRYRLQQQEAFSMELSIIDLFRGSTMRSLNSLSGGETFLVSLALALALADLAGSNIKFESLFIDEGFGSLDNETLNVALRVLNKLQEEGKSIGIISHVEMLQQSIPIQIKVIPTGGGLSKIVIP